MVLARQPEPHPLCITATKMNIVVFYIVCVSIGLAVDWALYERFTLYVESMKRIEPERSYKEILFPRILLTVIGLSLMAIDPYVIGYGRMLLWIGLSLFIISIAYLLIMAYRPKPPSAQ